jgi:6-phosphogluconolactonase
MTYAVPALEVLADAEAVAARAAQWLIERLREAIAVQGRAAFAASGGSTAARMCERAAAESLQWPNVDVFQVDERVAPAGHPDRNAVALRAAFARRCEADPQRFHWMPVEAADLQGGAASYATELRGLPNGDFTLDVAHLGMGADGHTASLFPGAPELAEIAPVTVTAEHLGRRRMTLTLPVINRARHILWVVTGAPKRTALERLLRGDPTLVASSVRRSGAVIVADVEAAPRRLL